MTNIYTSNESFLQFAADYKHLEILEYLITKRGFPVNAQDDDGWTPLHHASSKGCTIIVKYLISKGALKEALTIKGETPFLLACHSGCLSCVKYFVEKLKCNVTARDSVNNTAIHFACSGKYDCKDLVQYLVDKCKIDPNEENFFNTMPLDHAISMGHKQIEKYLTWKKVKQIILTTLGYAFYTLVRVKFC